MGMSYHIKQQVAEEFFSKRSYFPGTGKWQKLDSFVFSEWEKQQPF